MGKKKNKLLGFLCFAAVLIPLFSLNVFAAVEDIMNVSGIGEKRFENIRDYITIED